MPQAWAWPIRPGAGAPARSGCPATACLEPPRLHGPPRPWLARAGAVGREEFGPQDSARSIEAVRLSVVISLGDRRPHRSRSGEFRFGSVFHRAGDVIMGLWAVRGDLEAKKAILNLMVRVFEEVAAGAFLSSSWADLYRRDLQATPYQSPSWLTGWAQQLPPTAHPVVAVCEGPARQVLAALPLVHDHTGDRPRTYALSAPMGEYIRAVGPAAEDPQVCAALTRYLEDLADHGHYVDMAGLPAGGALARHLAPTDPATAGGRWHTRITDCAEIPLPLAYEEMSRSTRRDHRRRQRTWDELAQSHNVTYHRTRNNDELLTAYAVLARLHAHRWAGHTPPAGTPHTPGAPHWPAVLDRCGAEMAFIATLAVDTEIIAAQLCLTQHHRAYSVAPAIHPLHHDLAPGHALLRHLAQDLTAAGYRYLDLGRTVPGQHAYKGQYRPRWSQTLSATSAPPTAFPRPDERLRPTAEVV